MLSGSHSKILAGLKCMHYYLSLLLFIIIAIIMMMMIIIFIIIISSLSGLMLFPDKKCHNSGHQPVVLGIVAFFFFISLNFFFISYPSILVLFLPFQVKKASVMLQLSSPSLISLSISQSVLLLFLMPLLLLV